MKLYYIEDLGHDNYREHVEVIRESIREVVRREEITFYALAKFTGVSRQSLYAQFRHNRNIGFVCLVKLNNFLKRYKAKLEQV